MSARAYEHSLAVPFADVDMAKVLYFPRLFHYTHLAMEGFFENAVGLPYPSLLADRKLGFPTVHTEADYFGPIRYGERLRIRFTVRRLGRSSADLRFRFRGGDETETRAEARSTVVCVDMDRFASVPMPPDLRAAFEAHLEEVDASRTSP
jgi:4-hydroxybenzoyl-CoA thioesterase